MSNANPQNSMLDPEALASLAEWHRRGRRLWAKILSTVLTLSFVFPYLTWAFETKSYSSEKMPAVTCNAKSVTIPESFGTIRHSYQGGDKVIVHIQDLHCNYEVQMNIARMIDSLAKEHNMRVVAVEGASTPLNVSKLGTFPVREVKENVGKLLVKQGQIGGPEYYAATGANRIRLQGIENEAMYRQALKTVQGFLNAESQGYCYDLREILDELKDKLYNAPLKRYDEQRMAFREDRMSLLEYCTLMAKYAKRQRRSLETYPNVAVYIQKNQTAFPIAVDIDGLYRELDQLDAEIRASLYTTADQKQLDRFYRRIDLIEKMINISATPEEVAEFNADRTGFDVKKFAEFIRRHDAQGELAVDPDVYNLDIYMQQVDNFYRMTDQRSEQFVANLLKTMEKQHQNIAVMVSGGFHTDGVLQCLKQRGCSYVSVIPRILQQNVANPYFQLLRGRKQPLEKLLAKNQTMLALALRSAQGDPEAVITEANLEQFMPGAAPETFNRVKDFLELQQLLLNIAAVDSALNHNAVEQVAVKVKEMLADYPANVPGLNPLAGMTPEQAAKVLGEPNAVLPLPGMPSSMVRCAKNAFKDLKIEDQRIAFDDKHDYVLMSNAAIQAHRAQLARGGRAAAQLPSFQWAQSAVGALMATGMGTVAQVGSGVQNAFRNFNGGNLLDSLRSGLLGGVLDENGALKPTASVVALAAAGAVIAGVVVAVAIFGMPIIPVAAVSTVLMVGVSLTLFFGLNFGPGTAATAPQSGFFGEQTSEALRKALLVATRWGAHDLTALSMTEDLAERTVRLLFNELTPKQVESFFAFFGHEVRGEDDFTIADELLQSMQHGLEKSPRRLMLIAQAQDCLDRLRNGEEIEFFVNDRAFNLHSLKVVQVKQTDHVSESIRKGLDQVGAFLQVQDGTGIVYVMPDVDPAEALVHEVLEFLVGVPHEKVTALFEAARIGEIEKPAEADVRGKIVARTKATLASAWKDMNYLKGSEWEKQAEQVNQMIWDLDKLEYDDIIDILKSWPSPKYSDLLPSLSLTGQAVFNANRMALLASVLAAAFQNPSVLHNIQSGRDLIEALPSEVRQQPSFALAQAMGLMSFDSEVFELVLGKLNLQQKEHLLDILASSAMIFRPYDPALNQGAEPLARMKAHWGWLQVKNQFLLHDRILSIIRSAAGLNSRIGNFRYDDTPVFRTTYQEAKLKTQSGFGALRGETGRQLLTDSIIRALGVTLLPGRTAMEFIAELTDEQVEKYFGTRHATAKEWIEDWSQSRFTLTHEYIPRLFVKRKNPLDNPFESRKPESKKRYPFHPAADKIMQWICENPERFIVLAPGKYTEEMKAAQADQDFEHLGVLHFNGTVYIAQHAMSKLTERNLLVPVLMHEVAEMGVAGKSLSHDEAVALVEGATRFNNEALISKMETDLVKGALLGSAAAKALGKQAQMAFKVGAGIMLEPALAISRFSVLLGGIIIADEKTRAMYENVIAEFFRGYDRTPLSEHHAEEYIRTVLTSLKSVVKDARLSNLGIDKNLKPFMINAVENFLQNPDRIQILSRTQFDAKSKQAPAAERIDLMQLGMFHINGQIIISEDAFNALTDYTTARRAADFDPKRYFQAALLHEILEVAGKEFKPEEAYKTELISHTGAVSLVALLTGVEHQDIVEAAKLSEKAVSAEKKPGLFEKAKTRVSQTLADKLLDKFSMRKADFEGETTIMRPDFNVPIRISGETPIEWKQKDGKYIVANAEKLKYTIPEGADARIVAALPSLLEAARAEGNKGTVVIFHMEQKIEDPDGKEVKFTPSAEPVYEYIRKAIGSQIKGEVKFIKESINADGVSEKAITAAKNLKEGDVLIMENARICKAEKADLSKVSQAAIDKFRNGLEQLGTQFVFAAFGAIHRDHVTLMLSRARKFTEKSYLDFLVGNEVKVLDRLRQPAHPFCSIVAGSKVADKIDALNQNLNSMTAGDKILIGGRMAYAFLAAETHRNSQDFDAEQFAALSESEKKTRIETDLKTLTRNLGKSGEGVDAGDVVTAVGIMTYAQDHGIEVLLPDDFVISEGLSPEAGRKAAMSLGKAIPEGYFGVDLGSKTAGKYAAALKGARTVTWNGPLGAFEAKNGGFLYSTIQIGEALARVAATGATVFIGGGDSAVAIKDAAKQSKAVEKALAKEGGDIRNKIYISTAGGAMMAFLKQGFEVPGLKPFLERFATQIVKAASREFEIVFGTSGWRAKLIDGEFDESNVGRVAQAAAESLLAQVARGELEPKDGKNLRVLVAFDGRPMSDEYAKLLADVLITNGIDVTLGDDIATTPGVAAMTDGENVFDFAFHVTASHNTKEYNGIKLLQDGAVAPDDEGTITKIIQARANAAEKNGTYRRIHGISGQAPTTSVADHNVESYDQTIRDTQLEQNLKDGYFQKFPDATIDIDVFHGAAGPFVQPLANMELGKRENGKPRLQVLRTKPMRDLKEGALPDDYRPDPTSKEYKESNTYKNFEKHAAVGSILIGIDGDGDRLAVWVKTEVETDKGKENTIHELTPNELMVLFGWHNINEEADKIEKGVVTKEEFEKKAYYIVKAQQATNAMKKLQGWGAKKLGLDKLGREINLVITPTGSKYFGPFLNKLNSLALICAEPSGHMMMDGRFDDASYFAIKLLGIAGQYQKNPKEIVEDAKNEIDFKGVFEQVNLPLEDEKGNNDLEVTVKENVVTYLNLNKDEKTGPEKLAEDVSGLLEEVYASETGKSYPDDKPIRIFVNVVQDGKVKVMELKKARSVWRTDRTLEIKETEGMQWEMPDGSWIQLRFSGTEPLLRIYSEAGKNTYRQKIEDAVRAVALRGTPEEKGAPVAEEKTVARSAAVQIGSDDTVKAEYRVNAADAEKIAGRVKTLDGMDGRIGKLFKQDDYTQAEQADKDLASVVFDRSGSTPKNRLGWFTSRLAELVNGTPEQQAQLESVLAAADKIKAGNPKYIIFSGMGGSSLSVKVVNSLFGWMNKDLKIITLDDTDEAAIKDIEDQLVAAESKISTDLDRDALLKQALSKTHFIPVSKSGTTTESVSHFEYFEKVFDKFGLPKNEHITVVTDKDSPMDKKVDGKSVYDVLNIQPDEREDTGGRFTSPTTLVFLLPLALINRELVKPLLEQALKMNRGENQLTETFTHLAAFLHYMAEEKGKNKVTFIVPKKYEKDGLPDWAKQLFEESLGKEGKGVTIVFGEDLAAKNLLPVEKDDRVYVRVNFGAEKGGKQIWDAIKAEGRPAFEINLKNENELGGVMLGLQRATIMMGYLWRMCAVDQPAVEGYKGIMKKILNAMKAGQEPTLPETWTANASQTGKVKVCYQPLLEAGKKSGNAGAVNEAALKAKVEEITGVQYDSLETAPAAAVAAAIILLETEQPGTIVKIGAFAKMSGQVSGLLQQFRTNIFTLRGAATALGRLPQLLHADWQYDEAGKNDGLYFMVSPTKYLAEGETTAVPYGSGIIRSQVIAAMESRIGNGRSAVLILVDGTLDAAQADIEKFNAEVARYLGASAAPVIRAAGLKVPGSVTSRVRTAVNGNAREIEVTLLPQDKVDGEVASKFIEVKRRFEMKLDGRTLEGTLLEIKGKTYFQLGDRWVSTAKTGLDKLPLEEIAQSELVLGNPRLREFLNVELKLDNLINGMPKGLTAEVEMRGIVDTEYASTKDQRERLWNTSIVRLAKEGKLTEAALLGYLDDLMVVAHKKSGGNLEFPRAVNQLKILLNIVGDLKTLSLDEKLLGQVNRLMPFFQKRKLGYPTFAMNNIAKLRNTIKPKGDNKIQIVSADGQVHLKDIMSVSEWPAYETWTDVDAELKAKADHFKNDLIQIAGVAGEGSRMLKGSFNFNKLFGPFILIKDGMEGKAEGFLQDHGVKVKPWKDREGRKWLGVGHFMLALSKNPFVIAGLSTLGYAAEMFGDDADIATQDLAHNIGSNGNFLEDVGLAGHGRLQEEVVESYKEMIRALENDFVFQNVQGDDLGDPELGGWMAREIKLGKTPMMVLTTAQKVGFTTAAQVVKSLRDEPVVIGGSEVATVEITKDKQVLTLANGRVIDLLAEQAALENKYLEVQALLDEASKAKGEAQRALWFKAMKMYRDDIYNRTERLKFEYEGQEDPEPLVEIKMNKGGHLLEMDGQIQFIEQSNHGKMVPFGGEEFPVKVILALIPKCFNTNNFAIDPLARAANRDKGIKERYHAYLKYAQEHPGDENEILTRRREASQYAADVLRKMGALEWQTRNLDWEQFQMTLYPIPGEEKGSGENAYNKVNLMGQLTALAEATLAECDLTVSDVAGKVDGFTAAIAAAAKENDQVEVKNRLLKENNWNLAPAAGLEGMPRVRITQVPEDSFSQVKEPEQYDGLPDMLNKRLGQEYFETTSLKQRQGVQGEFWAMQAADSGLISREAAEAFADMADEIKREGLTLKAERSAADKQAHANKIKLLDFIRMTVYDNNDSFISQWSDALLGQGALTWKILSDQSASVKEARDASKKKKQNISTRVVQAIAAASVGSGLLLGAAGAGSLLGLGLSFGAMAWVMGLAGAVLLPAIGVPFLVLAAGMWWAQRGSAMVDAYDTDALDLSPAWREVLPMVRNKKAIRVIAAYVEDEEETSGRIEADLLAVSILPYRLQNVILAHEMAHANGAEGILGEIRAYTTMMKGLLGSSTPRSADGLAGHFQRLSTSGKIFSGLGAGMIVFGLLIPLIPALAIPGVAIVVPGLITLGVGLILTAAPFFRPQAGGAEAAAGKTAAGELPAGLGEFVPGANEAQRTAVSLTQVVKSTLAFTPLIFGVVAAVQVTAGSFAINSDIWLRALAAVFGAFAANLAIGVVTNNRLIQEATSLSVLPEKAPAVKGTVNQLMAVTQFMLAKAGDGLNRALAGQVLEKGILGFSGLLGVSAAVLSGLGAAAVGLPVLIIALPLGLLATGGAYVYARVSTARYFVDTKADGEAALDAGLLSGERNNETLYNASAAGDVMIDPTNFIGSIMERIDAATGQRDVSPVTLNMKLDEWRAKGFGRELKTIIKILKSDKTLAEGTLLQRLQVILETEKGADLRTRTALEDAALAVALQRALGQGQGAIGEVDKAGWKNGQNQKRGYYITASPEMIAALIAQVKSAQTGKATAELQVMEQALNRLQTAMKAYQAGEIIKIDAELAAEFMPYVENYARNTSRPGQIAFGENFEYNGKKEFKGAFLSGGHRTVKQTAADGKEIEVAAPGVYEATYETTGTEQLSAEADWTQNKQIRATDFLKTRTTPRVDFDRAGAVFNFMLAVSQGPLRGTVFGQAAKQWTLQHNRVEYWARIAESGRYPIIGKLLDKNNEESVLMEAMKDRYLDQTQCEREVLKAVVGMLKNNPELQTLDTLEEFTAFMEHLSVRLTGGLTLRMPTTQKELHRQLPNALWDKGMKSRWGYMKDLFQRFDNNITLSDQLENILFRKQMLSASQAA